MEKRKFNLSIKQQVLAFVIFTILVWTHAQLNPIDINIEVKTETRLLFKPKPVETEGAFDILMAPNKTPKDYSSVFLTV